MELNAAGCCCCRDFSLSLLILPVGYNWQCRAVWLVVVFWCRLWHSLCLDLERRNRAPTTGASAFQPNQSRCPVRFQALPDQVNAPTRTGPKRPVKFKYNEKIFNDAQVLIPVLGASCLANGRVPHKNTLQPARASRNSLFGYKHLQQVGYALAHLFLDLCGIKKALLC